MAACLIGTQESVRSFTREKVLEFYHRYYSPKNLVLSVVATGDTLAQARERVYAAVAGIELPGSHHRSDIALRAERGEVHA